MLGLSMKKLVWVLVILFGGVEVQASGGNGKLDFVHKLFVFGDSYADTGNLGKSLANSWKYPYGETFPGKPTGRFSDGRVLTDFIARLENLKSPLPYRWRSLGPKLYRYGMNFAFGGTGVFDTYAPLPNVSAQIQLFGQVIKEERYDSGDQEEAAMALISIAGNDYTTWYQQNNGSLVGITEFIKSVVNQLLADVSSIAPRMKKVAIVSLPPLGCVPYMTAKNSYQKCDDLVNAAAMYHNQLLLEGVSNLTKLSNESNVIILDLYSAFMSILQSSGSQGKSKFGPQRLKPCCVPLSSEYACGEADDKGNKLYALCDHPESTFFWDQVHPTQAGWTAVSEALKSTLFSLSS